MNRAIERVFEVAGNASVHLIDCITDDRPEMRRNVRILELAAVMHRQADELERLAREDLDYDLHENTRHEAALRELRRIAALESQDRPGARPERS